MQKSHEPTASGRRRWRGNLQAHTATHYNTFTLHRTATHAIQCHTLPRTATHNVVECVPLQHAVPHTELHGVGGVATHNHTLQHIITHPHCTALQHAQTMPHTELHGVGGVATHNHIVLGYLIQISFCLTFLNQQVRGGAVAWRPATTHFNNHILSATHCNSLQHERQTRCGRTREPAALS